LALLAWADALEELGDLAGANLLRQLPKARDEMAQHVSEWCEHYPGTGEVNLFHNPDDDDHYWFCGDNEIEGDDAIEIVGPLLARWDQFYPAVEWLVRELGLPFVERVAVPLKGRRREKTDRYSLGGGGHFDPLPKGCILSSLLCTQNGGGEDAGE
jgi:hypothetical protein